MPDESQPTNMDDVTPNTAESGTRDLEKDRGAREDSSTEEGPKDRQIHGLRWLITCTALYITCFLYGLDTTIAADVQGAVVEAFGHVEQLAWIGVGFPLGSVAVILLFGNLYNKFDMKWFFIITVALFEVGSALCGAAPNMSTLIVGRVIAGAGGSGIYLGSLNFVAALTTLKERGLYMAFIGFFWGIGAVLGPIIGGAFSVSSATWRWAFYINLVVGAASAPAYIFALPSVHPVQGVSIRQRLAGLDFLGFFLGTAVWVSFILAVTMAGSQWPWDDGRTIATWVVLGVVLILHVLQQYFSFLTTPARRAFPGHLLKQRTQVLLYIVTASGITSVYVVVYFIPIYFQFVSNDSALMAAVRLLPFVIIAISVNLLSGHLLSRLKVYMLLYVISGVLLILGGALLMVYLHPGTPAQVIYGLMIVIALGSGLAMLSGYAVATMTARNEDVGAAISMQNVAQVGGQLIALGIAGQVFQSTAVRNLNNVLAGQGFSEQEIRSAIAGAQSTLFSQLDSEQRDQATLAITEAMQKTVVLVPVAGAVMLIAALCMKRERLLGAAAAVAGA